MKILLEACLTGVKPISTSVIKNMQLNVDKGILMKDPKKI